MMKGIRAALFLLTFTVLTVSLPAHAFGEEVYLYSQENIAIYRRHSDQGNYCFWVNDAVFTAEEAERLLGSSKTALSLIGEMSFILRQIGEYQEISASLVNVEYSSLADGGYGEPCPVIFSYSGSSGGGQITAYAYILDPETESEPQSEKQSETQVETTAVTEQQQTGQADQQDEDTEPQTIVTEPGAAGTDGEEDPTYEDPGQSEVHVEEVQVIQAAQAADESDIRGTEQPETERASETQSSAHTTGLTEYLWTEEQAVLDAQSEERSAVAGTAGQDTSGGIWDMFISGPVYITTIGIGSTGFLFLVISIVLDVKLLMKYRRRLRETRMQVDMAKIRSDRDLLRNHNSQQLFYID